MPGHKFDQRVGHTSKNHADSERAPIFIQFIDAVWQLQSLFPEAFEFNGFFLKIVANHLISCCFGTFLYNSECERVKANLKSRTLSLWSHINYHFKEFRNTTYKMTPGKLCDLKAVSMNLRLWEEYYLQWYTYHSDQSLNHTKQ